MIVLSHSESADRIRLSKVKSDITKLNPTAQIIQWNELSIEDLFHLKASHNQPTKLDHMKAHWSSCSVTLPDPIKSQQLEAVFTEIPETVLRIKGCTRLDQDEHYTYFEKTPSQNIPIFRRYEGALVSGPKLLMVGPGSSPDKIEKLLLSYESH